MTAKLRSWWQKKRKHLIGVAIAVLVVGVLALVTFGYLLRWAWTGFLMKSLWDWLELLAALAIPVVVGFGAAWFTTKQTQASEARNKQQHDTELQIAVDNQQETALQAYINNMSELLLKEHLGELLLDSESKTELDSKLKPEYERVREIARVRTLTVLGRLDGMRKRSVLLFLHEAGLLGNGPEGTRPLIINLFDADFSQAQLRRAHLICSKTCLLKTSFVNV